MEIRLILVEPRYQINIGSIARVAKNFGITKLHIVNPKVNLLGKRAIMFSKHAKELLEQPVLYKDFDSAIGKCDMAIGTTGLYRKAKAAFMNVFLAEEVAEKIAKQSGKDIVVGIVIGRDTIGLLSSEIEKCDMIAYIGASSYYPVLNISHATGILLYEFTKRMYKEKYGDALKIPSNMKYNKVLFRIFWNSIKNKKSIRDKKGVLSTFKRIVNAYQPSKEEINAMITALK